eukprot:gb/GECG01006669.1/.p1 GENE.gb/GECG01006669.1/~~gb/GECG01006669.1/.p1  ORF type:complete len:510 (+),score=23.29 gb/GECG01006669.1/:1-1530(+)
MNVSFSSSLLLQMRNSLLNQFRGLIEKAIRFARDGHFKQANSHLFRWAGLSPPLYAASRTHVPCHQLSPEERICYPNLADASVSKMYPSSAIQIRVLYAASMLYYLDSDARAGATMVQLALSWSSLTVDVKVPKISALVLMKWMGHLLEAERRRSVNVGMHHLERVKLLDHETESRVANISNSWKLFSRYERLVTQVLHGPEQDTPRLSGLVSGPGPVPLHFKCPSDEYACNPSSYKLPKRISEGKEDTPASEAARSFLDIGLVTLCQYDAASSPLTAYSFSNKLDYCEAQNVSCYLHTKSPVYQRPPAWGKVSLVAKHLKDHDWVVWMDCDSFFMNLNISISTFIVNAVKTAEFDVVPDFVVSEDAFMLNTGIFAIRNSEWSRNFLRMWSGGDLLFANKKTKSPYIHHSLWEQAELLHAMVMGPYGVDIRTHTVFVPQVAINSYTLLLAKMFRDGHNNPYHSSYQHGDFILSFSGCRVLVSQEWCNEAFAKYFKQSRESLPHHTTRLV